MGPPRVGSTGTRMPWFGRSKVGGRGLVGLLCLKCAVQFFCFSISSLLENLRSGFSGLGGFGGGVACSMLLCGGTAGCCCCWGCCCCCCCWCCGGCGCSMYTWPLVGRLRSCVFTASFSALFGTLGFESCKFKINKEIISLVNLETLIFIEDVYSLNGIWIIFVTTNYEEI